MSAPSPVSSGGAGFTPAKLAGATAPQVGPNARPTADVAAAALRGHLHLVVAARPSGETYLARQSFGAPFHLSKPYWDGRVLQVQLVNSTAGILAGDELELDIAVETGAALSVTTPAAARAFMMRSGAALCRQRFAVATGASLEYLPEPLFPHQDSNYAQTTRLELAAGAEAFFVDQFAPGRAGRGECWAWRRLQLGFEVALGGRLLLREQLDASGAELSRLSSFHGMKEAWFATAVIAAPTLAVDSPVWAQVCALHREGSLCGVTALAPGVWIARIVASTGLRLRDVQAELRTVVAEVMPSLRSDLRKL